MLICFGRRSVRVWTIPLQLCWLAESATALCAAKGFSDQFWSLGVSLWLACVPALGSRSFANREMLWGRRLLKCCFFSSSRQSWFGSKRLTKLFSLDSGRCCLSKTVSSGVLSIGFTCSLWLHWEAPCNLRWSREMISIWLIGRGATTMSDSSISDTGCKAWTSLVAESWPPL